MSKVIGKKKDLEKDEIMSQSIHNVSEIDLGFDEDYEPPKVKRKMEQFCKKRIQYYDLSEYEIKALRIITGDFNKTYKEIKDCKEMNEPPLKNIEKLLIIQTIKKFRQKNKRINDVSLEKFDLKKLNSCLGKRKATSDVTIGIQNDKTMITTKAQIPSITNVDSNFRLARFLIENFNSHDYETQNSLVNWIQGKINEDQSILNKSLQKHVLLHSKMATYFYEQKQLSSLIDLLKEIDPMTAILINLQISLTNDKLMEEGNTLSQTLLPFISQCSDYRFLGAYDTFIMT